jgi:aspartate aminotransferase-like enzyme
MATHYKNIAYHNRLHITYTILSIYAIYDKFNQLRKMGILNMQQIYETIDKM